MPEVEQPWYKRAWVGIAAVVLAILGTLLAVAGKGQISKKKVEGEQKDRNKALDEKLADKSEVAAAKLETIDAKSAKAEGDIAHAHDQRSAEIAKKATEDAAAAADLSAGLLNSLNGADSKLRRG